MCLGGINEPVFCAACLAWLNALYAALDLGAYRDAPPGLRIWTGATVEKADVDALLPWLEWAFQTAKSEIQA